MYKNTIEKYVPKNIQEEIEKKAMLEFIDKNDDALLRSNLIAHFTSSAIVVNKEMDKVLFVHHNIYNSWGWVGGHNDGDEDFLSVAIKEAKEETGVKNIYPYSNDIFSLDTIYVYNHFKNGQYITDHLHLNITYLLVADEEDKLFVKIDENSGVKWVKIEEAVSIIDEPRMVPIYKKLFGYVEQVRKS